MPDGLDPAEVALLAHHEIEWAEYSTARLRRLRELSDRDGHWGGESAEFGDLLAAFQNPEPMRPVRWWP